MRASALFFEGGRDLENLQWKKQIKNGNKDFRCKDNPLFYKATTTAAIVRINSVIANK